MIERHADWKRAEQSTARFFPTRSPSAARERRLIRPLSSPPTTIRSMGDRSRGLGRRRKRPQFGGDEAGAILGGERREGGPATFGHQQITSGSPPLFNFAQIRLRKEGIISRVGESP
jgi:hypothetical protein